MNRILAITIFSIIAITAFADFEADVLESHNSFREILDIEPLTYSSELEASATRWAKTISGSNSLQHSKGRNKIGENLAMGTKGVHNATTLIELWTNEKKYYKNGKFPSVSTNGNWQSVAHYTQIIWRNTKEVGCAIAENNKNKFLVCHYKPSGNWNGDYVY